MVILRSRNFSISWNTRWFQRN